MKKFSWRIMILCCSWLVSCDKDNNGGGDVPTPEETSFTLKDGSIVVKNNPDVKIKTLNEFPLGVSTEQDFSVSRKKLGLKSTAEDTPADELIGNNYRFKLVAEVSTLTIDGIDVQATHVKITDDAKYAFVSYNERGDGHRGGVIVFKVTMNEGSLEKVSADVEVVSAFEMSKAEVSAVDYYNGKLYVTGASEEPKFGYNETRDGWNYAFYMVLELNSDMSIKEEEPTIEMLTSFQGTSIRALNNHVYITTGDGTKTQGGLYVYDATTHQQIKSILGKDHVRSVDVDNSNIYMMQAEPARVTRYDLNGGSEKVIYSTTDEAKQQYAKSEILAWKNYLLVAENESGLRMLDKDGNINDALDAPGYNESDWDSEGDVTNSVAINSDKKKDSNGNTIASDLLLLANGEKGIYWYDIVDVNGKDQIVLCNNNSMLANYGSANFIASKGNIVFVADGLGGLKILYIGFDCGDNPPPIDDDACDTFMPYLLNIGGSKTGMLPEGKSVFRAEADPIVQTLFSKADDILKWVEVTGDTKLYISYMGEWAGWHNSLGYFVIPKDITTDEEVAAYYNSTIKPDMCDKVGNAYVLKDKYTIFKDISDVTPHHNKVGILVPNTTFEIGNFKKGDKVVLFIAPNSWVAQNSRVEVRYSGTLQLFFTHPGLNKATGVSYGANYHQNFVGVQHNAFYSGDCKSIVMFFEDNHYSGDVDYNDIVFSISDNTLGNDLSFINRPKHALITGDDGKPKLVESATLHQK